MVTWLGALLIGIVLLVVAYYAELPPPLKPILNILGWILVVIGIVLFVAMLFGVSLTR